jgi:hypothetical protein
MPRIKNWKDLTLFRPDPDVHYTHLDSLFSDTIDWDLIATHLSDMIRVTLGNYHAHGSPLMFPWFFCPVLIRQPSNPQQPKEWRS